MAAVKQPYNVILAGCHDVGKTTIFNTLKEDFEDSLSYKFKFLPSRKGPRFESCLHQYMDSQRDVKFRLWDTGSMERAGGVGTMTKSYFRQAVAVILIYDTRDLESLNKLHQWAKMAEDTCDYKEHLTYALWGNEKGEIFSTVNNPVEQYHLENLQGTFPNSVKIEPQLVCKFNGMEEQEAVVKCYETLVRMVDRKMLNIEHRLREASLRSRGSDYETENEDAEETHHLTDEVHEQSTRRSCWC